MKEKKREVTNLRTVRLPRVGLELLGVRVGDVLYFQMDGEKIVVSKYGPSEVPA